MSEPPAWKVFVTEAVGAVLFMVMLAVFIAANDPPDGRFWGIMGGLYGLLGVGGMIGMRQWKRQADAAAARAIRDWTEAEKSHRDVIRLIRESVKSGPATPNRGGNR